MQIIKLASFDISSMYVLINLIDSFSNLNFIKKKPHPFLLTAAIFYAIKFP